MTSQLIRTEEYIVTGGRAAARMKELIQESNVRRIMLKDEHGKMLIDMPVAFGVIDTLQTPTWARVDAIVSEVAEIRIVVEKDKYGGMDSPEFTLEA